MNLQSSAAACSAASLAAWQWQVADIQSAVLGDLLASSGIAADPYFERPLPRWNPRGVRPERFLQDGVEMAVSKRWSVRDLLCSATHMVAEAVALTLRRRVPLEPPVAELVVTGGGQHNGLLLREIGRLTGLPLVRLTDLVGGLSQFARRRRQLACHPPAPQRDLARASGTTRSLAFFAEAGRGATLSTVAVAALIAIGRTSCTFPPVRRAAPSLEKAGGSRR